MSRCCREVDVTAVIKLAQRGEYGLAQKLLKARGWEGLPEGWTVDSAKKFWDSLTERAPEHKMTKCMKRMKGKVTDEGSFCGGIAALVGYR